MLFSRLFALSSTLPVAVAQYKGFNYGNVFTTGAPKQQVDFENEFNTAKNLIGTSGFTSARLYTMIQAGTTNTPISAIPAAINTQTSLLLGLWASAGQGSFDNEVAALTAAIAQYGTAFTDLIAGISVGSEDLYRISPTGILNLSGAGANPDTLVSYINQVRRAIAGTAAASKSIGHVDTWTAFVNGSNNAVISACDWLGMDAYPYFQNTQANSIENSYELFFEAYNATVAVSQGKPVWVTETGHPVSGPQQNQAVANLANAERYWEEIGCALFGNINTWYYTLQDAAPDVPSPSFGIVGSTLSTTPLFDLSCPAGSPGAGSGSTPSSSAASSPASSATSASAPSSTASVPSASGTTETAVTAITPVPGPSLAPSGSASSVAPSSAAPSQPAGSPSAGTIQAPSSAASTLITVTQPASSAPAPAPSSCPTTLTTPFEYPHLIVPVDASQPNRAFGTSYNGRFSPTISTLFNFDIPASYAGRTCSLVFLLPTREQLVSSSFTLSGAGGISVDALAQPATEGTSFASMLAGSRVGGVESVVPGNGYAVASGACRAGARVGYRVGATGTLDLEYFQNSAPAPLGLYITVC
ncbi:hypothetical protein H2201_006595 [Coniosporium apollinis]|uniref:glucan endo-1,3-beta-D-glucosidase n=1 Tax=Coniosporium apollinis TaxID=61459 RepID=A0ABQ9NNR2_9PEZI|nr:hypothetical protein H2201_006595 [Coniosporium apollinis]